MNLPSNFTGSADSARWNWLRIFKFALYTLFAVEFYHLILFRFLVTVGLLLKIDTDGLETYVNGPLENVTYALPVVIASVLLGIVLCARSRSTPREFFMAPIVIGVTIFAGWVAGWIILLRLPQSLIPTAFLGKIPEQHNYCLALATPLFFGLGVVIYYFLVARTVSSRPDTMRSKRATLTWLTRAEGGRTTIPLGAEYSTLGRVRGQPEVYNGSFWSLVVTKLSDSPENPWRVEVRWGMDDAPHHWLVPGAEFELYEGKRCVATGRIE